MISFLLNAHFYATLIALHVNILNNGSEGITTLFANIEAGTVQQAWNYDLSTGEIFNFYEIIPQAVSMTLLIIFNHFL